MASETVFGNNAVEPANESLMSPDLVALIAEAGLTRLQGILENSGIVTTKCLAELSEDETQTMCQRVRAAGFGPGHTCTLKSLRREAQREASLRSPSAPASPSEPASPSGIATPIEPASRLHTQLSRKHLQRLQPILEQCGVHSFECLGKLSNAEFRELVIAVRAAAFDNSHVNCLSELCELARTEFGTLEMLSPLKAELESLLDDNKENVEQPSAINYAASQAEQRKRHIGELSATGDCDASPRPLKQSRLLDVQNPQEPGNNEVVRTEGHEDTILKQTSAFQQAVSQQTSEKNRADALGTGAKEELHSTYAKNVAMLPKASKQQSGKDQVYMIVNSNGARVCSNKPRPSRQSIENSLINLRELKAEVVSYRDPATGKMAEARVPSPVLALLRILATCSGKDVSDQRIGRIAIELMEEHAYDPVRVMASLMPADLMNPETAVRVLGSGFCGIVFLEESTGVAVKVVLDDNARAEYDTFCAFATASLAPQPISCCGPRVVPGGTLYSIRMEAVSHTLQGVLSQRALRGARYGLSPPSEHISQKIGDALEVAFQRMRNSGLVHGDLHMGNVALKDHDTNPSINFIDFGSSASSSAWKTPGGGTSGAIYLKAGHEFDVFRLIGDLCEAFETLQEEFFATRKECERELRELKKSPDAGNIITSYALPHQLHHNRQMAGLQAFLAQEGLESTELAYNTVLQAVVKYACTQFEWLCEGPPCVRNRRMKQSAMRRENACKALYFNLFWDKALMGA